MVKVDAVHVPAVEKAGDAEQLLLQQQRKLAMDWVEVEEIVDEYEEKDDEQQVVMPDAQLRSVIEEANDEDGDGTQTTW